MDVGPVLLDLVEGANSLCSLQLLCKARDLFDTRSASSLDDLSEVVIRLVFVENKLGVRLWVDKLTPKSLLLLGLFQFGIGCFA